VVKSSKYIKPMTGIRAVLMQQGFLDKGKYEQLRTTAQRVGAIAGAMQGVVRVVEVKEAAPGLVDTERSTKALVALARVRDILADIDALDPVKYDRIKEQADRAQAIFEVFGLLYSAVMAGLDKKALARMEAMQAA
jgi:hypothetical protein